MGRTNWEIAGAIVCNHFFYGGIGIIPSNTLLLVWWIIDIISFQRVEVWEAWKIRCIFSDFVLDVEGKSSRLTLHAQATQSWYTLEWTKDVPRWKSKIPFLATNPSIHPTKLKKLIAFRVQQLINFYVLFTKVRKYVLNPGDYHEKILRHALPNERWIKIRQAENKSATDKKN